MGGCYTSYPPLRCWILRGRSWIGRFQRGISPGLPSTQSFIISKTFKVRELLLQAPLRSLTGRGGVRSVPTTIIISSGSSKPEQSCRERCVWRSWRSWSWTGRLSPTASAWAWRRCWISWSASTMSATTPRSGERKTSWSFWSGVSKLVIWFYCIYFTSSCLACAFSLPVFW